MQLDEKMKSRKGIFFTVDAVIALVVLTVGVVFIFITFTGEAVQQQTALYAGDMMNFFSNTRVMDVKEDWLIHMWCVTGPRCVNATHNLTHEDETLLSSFARLAHENRVPLARLIATNASTGLVQPQFGWSLTLQDPDGVSTTLISKTLPTSPLQLITAKSLVYFVDENHALEGPYVAQVNVWQ